MQGLIRWTEARRKVEGLSQKAYAESLRFPQPAYNQAVNRGETWSVNLLLCVLAKYPDETAEILAAAQERRPKEAVA